MQPIISTVPLMQMASGDLLSLQVYRFVGAGPGKKVYLQANLHGAEVAGNHVIHQLIEWLTTLEEQQLAGEIWLVPMCNPLGVNTRSHHFASGRFNPYDGLDWNRIFWDYEKTHANIRVFAKAHLNAPEHDIIKAFRQRILSAFQAERDELSHAKGLPVHELYRSQLQALALDADYLLDLHSSTNRGLIYVYYFQNREESTQLFDLDFGLLLNKYDGDAFDEAFIKPWLALERALAELGRPLRLDIEAFTFELGTGMRVDPHAIRRGLAGIKNYLTRKGVLQLPVSGAVPIMPLVKQSQNQKYYATGGGVVIERVEPGDRVQSGDLLYQLLSFSKGETPQVLNVRAEKSGLIYDVSTNEAVNQGEYVISIVEDLS
ncbi:succinylglutamate desuccinylase/aspartoacylase family protein [Romeria aff. gracilis LEGE 07310]|uniref:Succinylglutamate desuccinylase/aspartoacylase family protein n=1 Tax=Vasconcelosia minhoensis LEGE 07310 TaxID=915328 RepID=A0A8J7ALL8_9CYAN|nr:succinylglutamate desuccinylase/aspartoacylase family protein [Romeria gracilis]MBE9080173.1 succinylglutamate desuccinylase/aspartoacylase family protein [Romeria aff. gracilis LEGE 07310]